MNPPSPEPWLDDLLRAPHVDDDGFADSVALALPPPRRRRPGIVFAFGSVALAVGGFVVREAFADVTAVHTNLLVLISAAVVLAVAASLSGEHLRLSPAMLGATLPALPNVPTFPGPTGSGSEKPQAPVAVPNLRRGDITERALRHDISDLDDADFALIGRVSYGRTVRLFLRVLGLVALGVVLPNVMGDSTAEAIGGLFALGFAFGSYFYFLFRDAEATLLDAGFAPELARRLGHAAARRGLGVVDRNALRFRLTEQDHVTRGREVVLQVQKR